MDFSKFNEGLDDIKKELEEAENGNSDGREVPVGEYEATVAKCELRESKTGRPMVSIWLRIVTGEFKGKMIFYNQVVEKGFQIHLVKEFFKPFNLAQPLKFEDYNQFAEALKDVETEIKGVEFALNYDINEKGYNIYEITQVFSF